MEKRKRKGATKWNLGKARTDLKRKENLINILCALQIFIFVI